MVFARNNVAFKQILKLKSILRGIIKFHKSLELKTAFSTIIEETCKTLQCDRASVFLLDRKRDELWTKEAKGTNITIKVSLG